MLLLLSRFLCFVVVLTTLTLNELEIDAITVPRVSTFTLPTHCANGSLFASEPHCLRGIPKVSDRKIVSLEPDETAMEVTAYINESMAAFSRFKNGTDQQDSDTRIAVINFYSEVVSPDYERKWLVFARDDISLHSMASPYPLFKNNTVFAFHLPFDSYCNSHSSIVWVWSVQCRYTRVTDGGAYLFSFDYDETLHNKVCDQRLYPPQTTEDKGNNRIRSYAWISIVFWFIIPATVLILLVFSVSACVRHYFVTQVNQCKKDQ